MKTVWGHFLIASPIIGKDNYLLTIDSLIEVQDHPADPVKLHLRASKDVIVLIRRYRLCDPAA